MKLFTKQTLDQISSSFEQIGLKKIRRGFSAATVIDEVTPAISLAPREWPDDVFTLSVFAQAIWEDIESEYFQIVRRAHASLSMPSRSMLIHFEPPLSFSAKGDVSDEVHRLVEWFKSTGRAVCTELSSKTKIISEHLESLQTQKMPPRPEHTFLMLIATNVPLLVAQDRVLSAISIDYLRVRFEEFLKIYHEMHKSEKDKR